MPILLYFTFEINQCQTATLFQNAKKCCENTGYIKFIVYFRILQADLGGFYDGMNSVLLASNISVEQTYMGLVQVCQTVNISEHIRF